MRVELHGCTSAALFRIFKEPILRNLDDFQDTGAIALVITLLQTEVDIIRC